MRKNERTLSPWKLHFDRDGTEDVAIICDVHGHDLATSRHFWLPEGRDPIPPTLAAMWLMVAAPQLLDAACCGTPAMSKPGPRPRPPSASPPPASGAVLLPKNKNAVEQVFTFPPRGPFFRRGICSKQAPSLSAGGPDCR